MMTRLLVCGEALVGLATATASLPDVSSMHVPINAWIFAALLGLLPPAYGVAAGILTRVTNEAPVFGFTDDGDPLGSA